MSIIEAVPQFEPLWRTNCPPSSAPLPPKNRFASFDVVVVPIPTEIPVWSFDWVTVRNVDAVAAFVVPSENRTRRFPALFIVLNPVPLVPDEPEPPDVPELPDVPLEPEVPDVPDEPEPPDVPDDPDVPEHGRGPIVTGKQIGRAHV